MAVTISHQLNPDANMPGDARSDQGLNIGFGKHRRTKRRRPTIKRNAVFADPIDRHPTRGHHMTYTLEELQTFIALQPALKDGSVDKGLALRWSMLGWVEQTADPAHPGGWVVTARGQQQIDNPPPSY